MLDGIFSRRPGPAQQYVAVLMEDPAPADVAWLAAVATGGDEDRAAWELRYLNRSLGLLASQRMALDDRTASAVAHQLGEAMQADRHVAAAMVKLAERQFNERLSAYREMMAMRGVAESPEERVGRTLLLLAGAPRVGDEEVRGAAAVVVRLQARAVGALRDAFGEARLPAGGPA